MSTTEPTPLHAALEELLHELDRLMLIGDQGRRRRGLTTLSVETIRYARMAVASVLGGESAPETLRGLHGTFATGMTPAAPLVEHAQRVEALLGS